MGPRHGRDGTSLRADRSCGLRLTAAWGSCSRRGRRRYPVEVMIVTHAKAVNAAIDRAEM